MLSRLAVLRAQKRLRISLNSQAAAGVTSLPHRPTLDAILLTALHAFALPCAHRVFFTPVMVSVAKNFDGPIKLLFPRAGSAEELAGGKRPFAMLGLGDIVIPGEP